MFYASTARAVVLARRALRILHTGSLLAVCYKRDMMFYRNRLFNGYPCAWTDLDGFAYRAGLGLG